MKKNTFAAIGAVGCAAFLAASPAKAGTPAATAAPADDGISAEVSVGYDTHYIFRGFNYGENLVWGGVDVSAPLADGLSLDFGTWYATLAEDAYDELNLFAGLTYDLGAFQVGGGAMWYYYPQGFDGGGAGIDDSLELGATIGTSIAGVDVGLGYYYDLEENGSYVELSAEYTHEISDCLAIVAGTSISYADDYYGINGFNALGASLSLPIALTDRATLRPYVASTWEIDGSGQGDEIYGGVSLGVSF